MPSPRPGLKNRSSLKENKQKKHLKNTRKTLIIVDWPLPSVFQVLSFVVDRSMCSKQEDKQMNIFIPSIEDFVKVDHTYRALVKLIDFQGLSISIKDCYSGLGRAGYPVTTALKALVLQHIEDLSDREMERFLQENPAGKYFCGFKLDAKTPDHSYFGSLRKRLGTERIAGIFNRVCEELRKKGLISDIFTFVDATKLISKYSVWAERDEIIRQGEEELNNQTIGKVGADSQARFGCKGKNKFWYGYKAHAAVDMKHGFIKKIAVTPANVPDHKGLKHICPRQGMVFADKGYAAKSVDREFKKRGCHSGVIKKNNMKGKDFRRDKWLTGVRMPYEGIFSKMSERVRYRGIAKNQYQMFMEALANNFKRLIKIEAPPLDFSTA